MQRWEYVYVECQRSSDGSPWQVLRIDNAEAAPETNLFELLRELGNSGFELVTIGAPVGGWFFLVLKRPKP